MTVNHNLKKVVMIPMLLLYVLKKFKERQLNWLELLNFKNLIKRVIAILSLLVLTSNCDYKLTEPLVFNHNPQTTNDLIKVKIIRSDWNHCKCKNSILI